MSFYVKIENPPSEAVYWMPVIYHRDPETGDYTPYSPDDYLPISQDWLCPLSAGDGIMVDFRCVIYDADKNKLGKKNTNNIVIVDGEDLVFKWSAAGGVNPWMIGGLAVVGVGLIFAVTKSKR